MFTTTSADRTPLQRQIAGWLIALQVLTPMLYAGTAWAQALPTAVNADRSVQGQRPVVNVSANGVPVVQIAPPSAAGVSNNRFTDYNVGAKGLILNNTGANKQTQLAGWVAGNPMLGNTSAKTILNQVTGNSPTSLAGYTEVAGNQANVVVANPNGITCAGCGFINTPRVTLTTGLPEIGTDGALTGFRVQQGQIAIEGTGFGARNIDQVDLIARSLRVNAEIWANKLEAVTGAARVAYDSNSATAQSGQGPAPAVSLDVTHLGGMYANSIRLVGTENGVGVNSAGNIAALTGALEITQAGDVRIVSGSVQGKADVAISSDAGISNAGALHGEGKVSVKAEGTLSNSGVLMAGNGMQVRAGTVDNTGSIAAGADAEGKIRHADDLAVNAVGDVTNRGQLLAGRHLSLSARNVSLDNGNIHAASSARIQAQANVDNVGGRIQAGDVAIDAAGKLKNAEGTIEGRDRLAVTAGHIDNAHGTLKQTADAAAGDSLQALILRNAVADPNGALSNEHGLIASNASADIKVNALDNADGTIQSSAFLSISGTRSVDNTKGKLLAAGNLQIATDGKLVNKSGQASADGIVSVVAGGNFDNTSEGNLQGAGVRFSAAAVDNSSGRIVQTGNDLQTITLAGGFRNAGGVFLTNAQTLALGAKSIDNSQGTIAGTGTVRLSATDGVTNTHGSISGNGDVGVAAGALLTNTEGTIAAGGAMTLETAGALDNGNGLIAVTGNLSITAGSVNNASGTIQQTGKGTASINAFGTIDNTSGSILADNLHATASGISNNAGTISVQGGLLAMDASGVLDNAGGKLVSAGAIDVKAAGVVNTKDGIIQSASSADLKVAGDVVNSGGIILTGGTLAVSAGGDIDNRAGMIESSKDITLAATHVRNSTGSIIALGEGTMSITAGKTLDNTDGVIGSNGSVAILAGEGFNNTRGSVTTGKDLEIDTVKFLNQAGKFNVSGALTLKMKDVLDNRGNRLEAQGGLIIHAAGIENGVDEFGAKGELIVRGQGLLKLQTENGIHNADGFIGSRGDVALVAGTIDNSTGIVYADQVMSLSADGEVKNGGGTIQAGTRLDTRISGALDNREGILQASAMALQAGSLDNRNGDVPQLGTGTNVVDIAGIFDNTGGRLSSNGDTLHITAGSLANGAGLISHKGEGQLQVSSSGMVDNSGGNLLTAGVLGINVQHLANTVANGQAGRIQSGKQATIAAGGNIDNHAGSIISAGALRITAAGNADNRNGTLQAGTAFTGRIGGVLDNRDGLAQADAMDLQAGSIDNRGGKLLHLGVAEGAVRAGAGFANTGGTVYSAGSRLHLEAGSLDNAEGYVGHEGAGQLAIDAGTLGNNGGKILTAGGLVINAHSVSNDRQNGVAGLIQSSKEASIAVAGKVSNVQGRILSAAALSIDTRGDLDNTNGILEADGALALRGDTVNNTNGHATSLNGSPVAVYAVTGLVNEEGLIGGNGNVVIQVQDGGIANAKGTVVAGGALSITAKGQADNRQGTLQAVTTFSSDIGGQLDNRAGLVQAGSMDMKAGALDNRGGQVLQLDTDGDAASRVQVAGTFDNTSGQLTSNNGTLTVAAGSIDNREGSISHASDGKLDIGTDAFLANDGGKIVTAAQMAMQSGSLSNARQGGKGGLIQSGKDAAIATGADIVNAGGVITSAATLTMQAGGNINNHAGTLEAAGALTLQATDIVNAGGHAVSLDGSTATLIASGTLINDGGTLGGNGAVSLQVRALSNANGKMIAGTDMTLAAGGLSSHGDISAGGTLDAKVEGLLDNTGGKFHAEKLSIEAGSMDNSDGKLLATGTGMFSVTVKDDAVNTDGFIGGNGALSLVAKNIVNTNGTVYAQEALSLATGKLANLGGTLQAGTVLAVQAQDGIDNRNGLLQADAFQFQSPELDNRGGTILQLGTTDTSLAMTGAINNAGGTITSNGANMTLSASAVDNSEGNIGHAGNGNLSIQTAALTNNGGQLRSSGDIGIDAQFVSNTGQNGKNGLVQGDKGVTVSAANVDNSAGTIHSGGGIAIEAQDKITNAGGNMQAATAVTLQAGDIDNAGGRIAGLDASGISIAASGKLANTAGFIGGNGALTIAAAQADNKGGTVYAKHDLSVVTSKLDNTSGAIEASQTLSIQASQDIINKQGTLQASQLAVQAPGLDNSAGAIVQLSSGDLAFAFTGILNNTQGSIAANSKDVSIAASGVINNEGEIRHAGDGKLDIDVTGALTNSQGKIRSAGEIGINVQSLDNADGSILASAALTLQAGGHIGNKGGTLETANALAMQAASIDNTKGRAISLDAGGVTIGTAGTLVNDEGTIGGNGAMTLDAGTISNKLGTITAVSDLAVNAASLDMSGGSLKAGSVLDLQLFGALNNAGGTLQSAKASISVGSLNNNAGKMLATGADSIVLSVAGTAANAGGFIGGNGDVTFNAAAIDNTGGTVYAKGSLGLTADALDNTSGTLQADDVLTASVSQQLVNRQGTLQAQQFVLQAPALDNSGGKILQTGNANMTLAFNSAFRNVEGTIATNAAKLTLQASSIDNSHGEVIHAGNGTLDIDVASLANNSGKLRSGGEIAVTAGSVANVSGLIESKRDASITSATAIDNAAGSIVSGGALTVHAQDAFTNVSGTLEAAAALDVQAKAIDNKKGRAVSLDDSGVTIAAVTAMSNQEGIIGGNGNVFLSASSLDNTKGRVTGIGNVTVATPALTNASGTIKSQKELTIDVGAAGFLSNTAQGVLQGEKLVLNAPNLSNAGGSIIQTGASNTHLQVNGTLDNAGGTIASNGGTMRITAQAIANDRGVIKHGGSGSLTLAMPGAISNSGGTISSNGNAVVSGTVVTNTAGGAIDALGTLNVGAGISLNNNGGVLQSDGALTVSTPDMSNNGGSVLSDGKLTLGVPSFNNTGGTLSAAQIAFQAMSRVKNAGGKILQTGAHDLNLVVGQEVDNTNGTIAANGNVTLGGSVIRNQGGTVRAAEAGALSVTTGGAIDNSGGTLAAGGNLVATGASLNNAGGQVSAAGQLNVSTSGSINNNAGTIASVGNNTVSTSSLSNRGGTLASTAGTLALGTSAHIDNTGGRIESARDLSLHIAGLTNTNGQVTADNLQLNTQGVALDNAGGKIVAHGTLNISSGQLNNHAGLVQANGAMTINTNGQALINTQSGSSNGIAGMGSVALRTGSLNNQNGYIGAKGALSVNASTINNTQGAIVGESAVGISAGSLANSGGQITGVGNVDIDLGGGAFDNSNGLVLSTNTLTVTAGSINNSGTTADKGLQGNVVSLNASNINNAGGTIRADHQLTLTASSLDNTSGTISSAGNVINNAFSTTNTQGTLIAAKKLAMNSKVINGVGQYLSQGDLEFNYDGSYTNTSRMVATGNLTINSKGSVTNSGQIGASNTLNLSAVDIYNLTSGEIKAGTANITASNSLTNHGIIDGVSVNINANGDVVNHNKIYGDTLGITAVGHLANTTNAVIGARNTLTLTGGNITNYADGLILSTGNMTLNSQGRVYNRSGRIESFGNLTVQANGLENLNENLTMTTQVVGSEQFTGHILPGSITPLAAGTYAFNNLDNGRLVLDSPNYPLNKYGAWPYAPAVSQQGSPDNGYTYTSYYPPSSHVWSLFGVAPPGPKPADPYAGQWFGGCEGEHPGSACMQYYEDVAAWADQVLALAGQLDQKIVTFNRNLYGRMVGDWYIVSGTRTTTETKASGDSRPGQLFVGGNLTLAAPGGSVLNDKSQIVVKGSVSGSASNIVQIEDKNVRQKTDVGTWQLTEVVSSGIFGGHKRKWHTPGPYSIVHTPEIVGGATVWKFEPGTQPGLTGQIGTQQLLQVGQSAAGGNDANGNVRNLQNANGSTSVSGGVSVGGVSANPNGAGVSGAAVTQLNGQGGGDVQTVSGGAGQTVTGATNVIAGSSQNGNVQVAGAVTSNAVNGIAGTHISGATAGTAHAVNGISGSTITGAVQSATITAASGNAAGSVTGNGQTASIGSAAGNAGSTVTAKAPSATIGTANGIAANSVTGGPGAQYSVTGTAQQTSVNGAAATNRLVEVKAAGNGDLTVRSIVPTLAIPGNVLFATRTEPGIRWLVETDPRFADYRSWLSSDFMLAQLGRDPSAMLKRLGDGFYEQKLVADQIVYATGTRFVGDYSSNEEQYQALMQNGVEFGNKFQLTVGVALSEEQMQQLTSDIVWLVEKEVTLADGSMQNVLVPQAYVRVKEGGIRGDGTLISAASIDLNLTGDLDNNALIATRDLMQITAQNIANVSGGRLLGGSVELSARNDLDNLSGIIAGNAVTLQAGRDVNLRTRTITTEGLGTTVTGTDAIAGVRAENLTISAGRDLNVLGAKIDASKDALLTADRNLTTGTVQSGGTMDIAVSGHIKASEVKNVGSMVSAGNNLTIGAGMKQDGDLAVKGSTLNAVNDLFASGTNVRIGSAVDTLDMDILTKKKNATDTVVAHQESALISQLTSGKAMIVSATGSLTADKKAVTGTGDLILQGAALESTAGKITLTANNDVQLVEQLLSSSRQETHQYRGGTLVSKKAVNANSDVRSTQSIGNTVSGDSIVIGASHDILARASTLVGTRDVSLLAKNDITLGAAQDTAEETRHRDEKTSGLFSSGGASITLGKQQTGHDRTGSSVTHAGSQVASLQGNVVIDAGKAYTQTASQVLALQGDIDITAQKVDIDAAADSATSMQQDKSKSSGLTLAVSSPLLSAVQTVDKMADAAQETSDPRMKALAAATAALTAKNVYDAVTDPAAAASIQLSLTLGSSKSESTQFQSSSTAVGSTITAGNNLSIIAKGAGRDSDITVIGSTIKAGNDATLKADGDLLLQAAQNTSELHRDSKSSSAGVGVYVSMGANTGFGLTANASTARGNADGSDVVHSNTHVEAGNIVTVISGGDTDLKGATVTGRQVIADISGDLRIESLQDSSTYHSKDKSAGGSISIGFGTEPVSGSIHAGKSNIDSTFVSVIEQSGIQAGDGGFQVTVKGNTDLKGGVIAGSDKAVDDGKNRLSTQTLTASDLENKAEYKGSSIGVGLSYSSDTVKNKDGTDKKDENGNPVKTGYNGFNASLPGVAVAKGDADSVTRSGISGGVLVVTDDAKQTGLTGKSASDTVAAVNRDTANTENSLKPIFDEQEVKAGFAIVTTLSKEAGTFLDNRAKEADAKNDEAKKKEEQARDGALTEDQRKALIDDAAKLRDEAKAWEPGSTERQLLTALTAAASGNVTGGAGELVQAGLVNYLQQQGAGYIGGLVKQGKLVEGSPEHAVLHAIVACAGAAGGNQHCGSGAMGAAASSLLTNLFRSDPNESSASKEAKGNLLTSIVAGLAATGIVSDPAVTVNAAVTATHNNYLKPEEILDKQQAMKNCAGNAACLAKVENTFDKKSFAHNIAVGSDGVMALEGLKSTRQELEKLLIAQCAPPASCYADAKNSILQIDSLIATAPSREAALEFVEKAKVAVEVGGALLGAVGQVRNAVTTAVRDAAATKVTGAATEAGVGANTAGQAWKGAGPMPGTIGVGPSTESVKALQNFSPNKGVEYVFDPASSTFVVGNGAMKHSPLAASIGADTNQVVGGIFTRGSNGSILTNEGSGHFWKNWTPEVRQQYVDFMRSKGINVIHTEGK